MNYATNVFTLYPQDPATLQAIATTATLGSWVQRRDDEPSDGAGGVREPRPRAPIAPAGAVALRLTDG